MATFQSEYEDTTNAIDTIVSTQVSNVLDWINTPGGLSKVVTSSAGFAWGYNGASVWSCQLPCTGNWQTSDLSAYSVGSVLDIAADPTMVYVLYTSVAGNIGLLVTPSNRQGVWASISVPFSATKIFSTHTYIWAQDSGNNKQMCPKPCVMANWMPIKENTVKITSSTDTQLYGVDPTGEPVQTDETMRSGWSPLTGFGTKVQSVVGGDSAVYAVDVSSNTLKYDGKTVSPVATSGYTPASLTAGNNQLWMTSVTPGQYGNIFNRIETPDDISLLNTVAPLDKKRDEIVSNVESKFNLQTDIMTVNKQATDIITFFKQMFNLDRTTAKKANAQAGHIVEEIRSTQAQLDRMTMIEPIMIHSIILLLAVALIYIAFGGIGFMVHVIAGSVLAGGIYFILNSK